LHQRLGDASAGSAQGQYVWLKQFGNRNYKGTFEQIAIADLPADEYRRKWPVLHAKTVERVTKATASLLIAKYFAGDCREFLAHADKNAVCISFPPTYKGGYEHLFKKLDAVFDWPNAGAWHRNFGRSIPSGQHP